MTGTHPEGGSSRARGRGFALTLLRIASLAVLALTLIVVLVAVPVHSKRQHTVSLGGLEGELNDAGEVVITKVVPGTPSAEAGLKPGDVLAAVEGQALKGAPDASRLLERLGGRAGTPVSLTVRTGQEVPRAVEVPRSPEPGSIAERLGTLGLGMDLIVGYLLILDICVLLVYLGVAAVLIARRRGNVLTLFAAVALATFGAAATTSLQVLAYEPTFWGRIAAALVPTGFAAAFTFLGFLYPSGRWVPRFGRLLAAVVWIWTVAQWFWPAARPGDWSPLAALAVYLLMIIAMFAAQLHRYRRVATVAERQQIKWFVLALAAVVAGYAVSQIAALAVQDLGLRTAGASGALVFVLWLVSTLGYQVPYALLAVAIGAALLRHRLWDIDIVINRSLVYSALTSLLAVMSAIILPLANRLLGGLAGKVSPILALAVTAAFPILAFQPLRARLQRFVDRKMKPEDVTFDEVGGILDLQVQALFPSGRLLTTLVDSVAAQLGLAAAAAYVPGAGERLTLARETPAGQGLPAELALDAAVRDKLCRGQVAAPPDGSEFSFFVPLTAVGVPAREFCGVLALGRRQSGKGYATALERGLQKLGTDAGRALYVARLREFSRPAIEDRLDGLERRLAALKL